MSRKYRERDVRYLLAETYVMRDKPLVSDNWSREIVARVVADFYEPIIEELEQEKDSLRLERDGLEQQRKRENQYLLDRIKELEYQINEELRSS